jgi:miniconductance mechanosensitive channel
VFLYWILPFWLEDYQTVLIYSNLILEVYFIFLIVWIIRSFLNAAKEFFKTTDSFKDKPVDSFVQVAMILVWFMAIILVFSILTGKEVSTFLTAMGALSAVILLIFKDTILGLVASIQLTSNDLIRIGDWITMKQFGADGDVIEINLNSVKVQNFDKTITTIPTYKLISDSFKNWRGMSDSNGRRIKRALLIKGSSIKFMGEDELSKLQKIKLISDYISQTKSEIIEHNSNLDIVSEIKVNGRNLTNIGLFRKYTENYLVSNKLINNEMTVMCRQLTPTSQGVPLEIYAFITDKEWKNYENIVSDLFDHLLASLSTFDLELFELPSNINIK